MSSKPHRKLWVCEQGASATSVPVQAGELVDDVKTLVLARYANSLGKILDAANMTITITPRARGPPACRERMLSPDEDILDLLDACFPGGQKLIEALIIGSAPKAKRNPSLEKHWPFSARTATNTKPHDIQDGPETPVRGGLTIREIQATPQQESTRKQLQSSGLLRSVSAGNTNAGLKVDSVGFKKSARDLFNAGKKSPRSQIIRRDSSPSEDASVRKPHPRRSPSGQFTPLRTGLNDSTTASYFPPTHPSKLVRPSSQEKCSSEKQASKIKFNGTAPKPPLKPKSKPKEPRVKSSALKLDSTIPPINVLIAEDNSLVSRVVSKQMQKLNVRWDTAVNGLEAVKKWKAGKFHLISMDIGMPVMDGLEATKEIRRLERGDGEGVQKGPVIIVALTASSLASDRDGALNAGCNDFITKPLEQSWLAQKVREWGCMQALIDYEEWRIWKGYQIRDPSED